MLNYRLPLYFVYVVLMFLPRVCRGFAARGCNVAARLSHNSRAPFQSSDHSYGGYLKFARILSTFLRASNANKVDALSKERHENIIDGKSMAESIREDIKNEVERLKVECNVTPGLAVILVGSRSDSTSAGSSHPKSTMPASSHARRLNLT